MDIAEYGFGYSWDCVDFVVWILDLRLPGMLKFLKEGYGSGAIRRREDDPKNSP